MVGAAEAVDVYAAGVGSLPGLRQDHVHQQVQGVPGLGIGGTGGLPGNGHRGHVQVPVGGFGQLGPGEAGHGALDFPTGLSQSPGIRQLAAAGEGQAGHRDGEGHASGDGAAHGGEGPGDEAHVIPVGIDLEAVELPPPPAAALDVYAALEGVHAGGLRLPVQGEGAGELGHIGGDHRKAKEGCVTAAGMHCHRGHLLREAFGLVVAAAAAAQGDAEPAALFHDPGGRLQVEGQKGGLIRAELHRVRLKPPVIGDPEGVPDGAGTELGVAGPHGSLGDEGAGAVRQNLVQGGDEVPVRMGGGEPEIQHRDARELQVFFQGRQGEAEALAFVFPHVRSDAPVQLPEAGVEGQVIAHGVVQLPRRGVLFRQSSVGSEVQVRLSLGVQRQVRGIAPFLSLLRPLGIVQDGGLVLGAVILPLQDGIEEADVLGDPVEASARQVAAAPVDLAVTPGAQEQLAAPALPAEDLPGAAGIEPGGVLVHLHMAVPDLVHIRPGGDLQIGGVADAGIHLIPEHVGHVLFQEAQVHPVTFQGLVGQGIIRRGILVHRGADVLCGGVVARPAGQGGGPVAEILVIEIRIAVAGGGGEEPFGLPGEHELLTLALVGAAEGARLPVAPGFQCDGVHDDGQIVRIPGREEALAHPIAGSGAPGLDESQGISGVQEPLQGFLPHIEGPAAVVIAALHQHGHPQLRHGKIQVHRDLCPVAAGVVPGESFIFCHIFAPFLVDFCLLYHI